MSGYLAYKLIGDTTKTNTEIKCLKQYIQWWYERHSIKPGLDSGLQIFSQDFSMKKKRENSIVFKKGK